MSLGLDRLCVFRRTKEVRSALAPAGQTQGTVMGLQADFDLQVPQAGAEANLQICSEDQRELDPSSFQLREETSPLPVTVQYMLQIRA